MDSPILDGLKTKQYPVDIWTTREHLCLTSAVSQAGDKNWSVVSKTIQQITTEKSRPQDWYSTRNCALQYAKLIEQAEAPKKKKESELVPNESSQQYLLKMLSKRRSEELKEILEEEKAAYMKLRTEILLLESNQLDGKLHQYWNEMIKEQEMEAQEEARLQAFLKEREEKIKLVTKAQALKASVPSSPKLKTWGIPSPNNLSTSEQTVDNPIENKKQNGCTDQKEKPQSLEDSFLKEPPTKLPLAQTVTSNLFPPDRDTGQKKEEVHAAEKTFPLEVKEDEEEVVIKMPPEDSFEAVKCDSSFETNLPLDYTSNLNVEMREEEQDVSHEETKKIMDSSVDACEVNAEEEEEEEKEESPREEINTEDTQHQENGIKEQNIGQDPDEELDKVCKEQLGKEERNKEVVRREEDGKVEEEEEEAERRKGEDKEGRKQKWKKKNLPLLIFPKEEAKLKIFDESDHVALIKKDEGEKPQDDEPLKGGADPPSVVAPVAELPPSEEWEKKPPAKKEVKDEYEFDDDASRESTDVKDYTYSRSDRRKFSLSENVSSPVVSESTPSSPASTNYGDDPEVEKMHRSWKRSIMLIWNDIAAHKNASLFLKPITEEKVPGYHRIVHRPVDLMSIKRNIENGTIRSTLDFQRDVMLMFVNAKMYNTRDLNICRMAHHMMNDAVETIEEFIQAQMLAKVVESPQKSLRRETRESSAKRVGEDGKRKRDDRGEEKPIKRRKIV